MSKTGSAERRRKMVDRLVREGTIKSDAVKRAFLTVPREIFVWGNSEGSAYVDSPQPLGMTDQTISAPHMIAIMLEEADLKPGMKILEVGAGSGYSAALMCEIVAPSESEPEKRGHVTSIEVMNELVQFASENIERAGYSDQVTIRLGDGTLGYPKKSSEELYDRIIVAAAAPHTPKYLELQLKKNGVLLIPVGNPITQNLLRVIKSETGRITSMNICECMFVPLIGEDGFH